MKIAIIQNVTINDHRSVHTNGITTELSKRGHDIDAILQNSKEEPQFKKTNYKKIFLEGKTYSIPGQIKFIKNCIKFLKNQNYDILHTKNPFSSLIPALIYKKLYNKKCKVIYDIRGLWIDFAIHRKSMPKILFPILTKIETFLCNKTDKIISISKELEKILIQRGVNPKKITTIIGDGTNYKKIKNLKRLDIRKKLNLPKNSKVIGYLGTVSKARSSQKIIDPFKILHNENKNTKLVFIGPIDKGEKSFFKNYIKNKNLEDSVFFTGFLPHEKALRYAKSFDVAVSYHSGNLLYYNVAVPTKILEYMTCGLPIVTTNHKMYKNILKHKKTAYLTKPNTKDFAKAMKKCLENKKLRLKISKNALKEGRKYSFERIVDEIEEIFFDFQNQLKNSD